VDVAWDDEKDLVNQQKHGLSFAEASELFESGADYWEIFDADRRSLTQIGDLRRRPLR
jgi:uncharacterized DUF497 family protein